MGEINFYLKKPVINTGMSLIVLHKQYHGKRLVFSIGESIYPNSWNKKKQRVKNNNQTTADGKKHLNDYLSGLQNDCEKVYNKLLENGVPEPITFRNELNNINNNIEKKVDQKDKISFFNLIKRFIENGFGGERSHHTLNNYKTCRTHLLAFEEEEKVKLDFDAITLDFYYKFVTFLKGKGLEKNTIGKNISVLKAFMRKAYDLEYTKNIHFLKKDFKVPSKETYAVYLNEKELDQLYRFDFNQKSLEHVRDMFIFSCYTGLRFSDIRNFKKENIVSTKDGFDLIITPQKTGEEVQIPCLPQVLEIFNKYKENENKLPRVISNQKYNQFIKEACKLSGLNEKGRLSSDLNLELWECVSSHTGRRSFITNFYYRGVDTTVLRMMSGHASEKSFKRYLKVDKQNAAMRFREQIKKTPTENKLKVA
jgi:integrase